MTVGFFSPLPPAATGVADYAQALLEALQARCQVRVQSTDADVCLYHLGNNQLHRAAYQAALERPGVAVLHDAVLHHFFLGWLDREAYLREFVYNYGESSRGLAAGLWEERALSAQDARYFERALVRRIAEVSRAVVVHNPAAARIVQEHAPRAHVVEIPHLFRAPALPSPQEVAHWRSAHGIGVGTFLFGVFGHLRESKRLHTVLRAFRSLGEGGAALLVAGDFASPDLERALGPELTAPGVVRAGFLSEPEFWLAAMAVDACLNLRYPSAGETSGVTIRLMGIGKPVVLTAGEEICRLPGDACIRIDSGVAEEPMLEAYMGWLAAHPEHAREIGQRASAHIAAQHSLDRAAERYLEVLSSCCA
ncbi:MAG: hypothetical protein ABSD27_08020 [Bryobacteraceae bacterium]